MSLIVVEHSAEHPSERSEMDVSQLEAFSGADENDDVRIEWSGYRCLCHGWEVQRSAHATVKKSISAMLSAGEIR